METQNKSQVALTSTQKKIANAKLKLEAIKQIEKLEREVNRLQKNITNKTQRIEELVAQL